MTTKSQPTADHRRLIAVVYLVLRLLFVIVSLAMLAFFPRQLARIVVGQPEVVLDPLWQAWLLFAAWSVPLAAISGWGLNRNRLRLVDLVISISVFVDAAAIFVAARATGGPESPIFHSIYFLLAIHSYHFQPPESLDLRALRDPGFLATGPLLALLSAQLVYWGLAGEGTPGIQGFTELGLQALTAAAFLLVRWTNHSRSLALDRAHEELDEARSREARLLEAMGEVSILAGMKDRQAFADRLDHVVEEIGSDFGLDHCRIGLFEGAVPRTLASFWRGNNPEAGADGFIEKGLAVMVPRMIARGGRHFHWRAGEEPALPEFNQDLWMRNWARFGDWGDLHELWLLSLLSVEDSTTPVGCLLAVKGGDEGDGLTDANRASIDTLARQLAVVITNFRQHQQELDRQEHESFLNQLTLEEDLDSLFECVLQYLNRRYRSRVASLWLATEDGFGSPDETLRIVLRSVHVATLHLRSQDDEELSRKLKTSTVFKHKECFVGRFFAPSERETKVQYVEDVATTVDSWREFRHEIGTSRLIAIPLRRHVGGGSEGTEAEGAKVQESGIWREVLGVICIRPMGEEFLWTDEMEEELERFASHLAVLVDQIRFRRRYEQIALLKDRLPSLAVQELREFYRRLVELVRDVLSAEACSYFTFGPQGGLVLKGTTAKLTTREVEGGGGPKRETLDTGELIDTEVYRVEEKSITRKIAEVNETTLIYDVHQNPRMSKSFMEETETGTHKSLIGVPVSTAEGKVVGILRCINKAKQKGALLPVFVQGDKEFMQLIGGIVSRFIEHAEASAAKQNFLNQLVHELSSPLNALLQQVDFIEAVFADRRQVRDPKEQLDYLREQARYLDYIITDIQFQFGKGQLLQARYDINRRVDLRPTIERIKKLLLPMAREDRESDILTGTRDLPELFVDPRRMEQVLFNLVQNAVKYSRRGARPVFLGYERAQNATGDAVHRLRVQNWGVGIEPGDEEKVFDEYQRGSNVHGAAPSGTGLGLTVARRIVEAHGGRLWVLQLRDPTEFAVDLPTTLDREPPRRSGDAENPLHR